MEKMGRLSNTNMFLTKLKNRVNELTASHVVEQIISLPIFSFDLSKDIDCNLIKDKCLKLRLEYVEHYKENLVKNGWQSPYFTKKSKAKEFEIFSDLITLIETKMSRIDPHISLEIDHFWAIIYDQDNYTQGWHNHLYEASKKESETLHKYSAVFYPLASLNSAPIEFEQEQKENILIEASTGKLLIFPSVTRHRVPVSNDLDLRISMAFNFVVKLS